MSELSRDRIMAASGRGLDEMVAIHLFQWISIGASACGGMALLTGVNPANCCRERVPDYSTDHNAAALVLETMRQDRWLITMGVNSHLMWIDTTGKGWLDIVTVTGAVQRTRTDGPAEMYWRTYTEAREAVLTRLRADVERAHEALEAFQCSETNAVYIAARKRQDEAEARKNNQIGGA